MKTLLKNTGLALFSLLILTTSCQKEDDVIETPTIQADGTALAARFGENRADLIQTFTIDAANGGAINSEKGTIVIFQPNSFQNSTGEAVSGNISIELIEIFDRATMLLTNRSTMGISADGQSVEALKSGGEFYLNATQNGQTLTLVQPALLQTMISNTGDADTGMRIFKGIDQDCDGAENDLCEKVVWEVNENDGQKVDVRKGEGGNMYSLYIGDFGWTNIDRWYNDPRPKTMLYVDVPEGYNDTNCAVYLSYDGEPSALARFDIYDETQQMFTEHYGQIPIGMEVHFIFVTEIDGQMYYTIQGATIVDNHVEVIADPQPVSQGTLETLINDLP